MKRIIIALMIGLLIGSMSNVYAAVGDTVEAIFAEFSYKVNGVEKVINSPALVVNGKSYLPTTEIANMLGNDVTYKADSRTIEFNTAIKETSNMVQSQPITVSGQSKLNKIFILTKSSVIDIGEMEREIFQIDGETYVEVATFGRYHTWDPNKDPSPFTVTLPDQRPVTFLMARNPNNRSSYSPGIDTFSDNGSTYVKLSALGLKATVQGDTLVIEKAAQ